MGYGDCDLGDMLIKTYKYENREGESRPNERGFFVPGPVTRGDFSTLLGLLHNPYTTIFLATIQCFTFHKTKRIDPAHIIAKNQKLKQHQPYTNTLVRGRTCCDNSTV